MRSRVSRCVDVDVVDVVEQIPQAWEVGIGGGAGIGVEVDEVGDVCGRGPPAAVGVAVYDQWDDRGQGVAFGVRVRWWFQIWTMYSRIRNAIKGSLLLWCSMSR